MARTFGGSRLLTVSSEVTRTAWRALLWTGAAVVGACWLVYLWEITLTVPAGLDLFDFANNLLYAQDMLHGNWLLHGWVVTQDPHWLTDDMMYVAGLAVRGFDPGLLHLEPMLVYVILIVFAAAVSVVGLEFRGSEHLVIAGIALLPLVFPSRALASQVLIGPYHTGTTAAALGAILALRASAGRTGVAAAAGLMAAWILLTIGRVGDPYMLTLGILPLILAWLYACLARPGTGREGWSAVPLCIALAAWAAAVGVLWVVPRLGGFTMRLSLSDIIPLSELVPRVVDFTRTCLDLAGANFFGMSLGSHHAQLLFTLVRFGYLCAVVWAIARAVAQAAGGVLKDWVSAVVAAAVLLSGAGSFLYAPGDYLGDEHRTPAFILSSIVLARVVATGYGWWLTEPRRKRALGAVLAVCAVAFVFGTPPIQLHDTQGFDNPQRFPQLALARWLEQQGFWYGYGDYNTASIVTVETRGRVVVRALISTGAYTSLPASATRLEPNIELMANNAWFDTAHPATFVIVDEIHLTEPIARRTFGEPDQVYTFRDFRVLTYHSGILCTLPPLSPAVNAAEAAGVPPAGALCRRLISN